MLSTGTTVDAVAAGCMVVPSADEDAADVVLLRPTRNRSRMACLENDRERGRGVCTLSVTSTTTDPSFCTHRNDTRSTVISLSPAMTLVT